MQDVKEHIVQIVKNFRKYSGRQGTSGTCSDVFWNNVTDCLEAYTTQWDIILKIFEDNLKDIESAIYKKVSNIGLKHAAQEYLLKSIPVALDIFQKKMPQYLMP